MDGPMRFSEVAQAVPELSDRLLSERMKELESRGIVSARCIRPARAVEYELSGWAASSSRRWLQRWANRWLGRRGSQRLSRAHRARVRRCRK
jgi:DNA-binding HxlR family transcriptional regulator